MKVSRIVLSTIVILVFAQMLYAQTAAAVNGYVKDELGAPLYLAKVEVKNLSTGILRSAESDQHGFYRVMQLVPGQYELSVTASGFAPCANRNIILLEVGHTLSLNITLEKKWIGEEARISALVGVSENEVSQIINLQQIERLPINGRRFVDFALLTPNVTLSRDGRSSNNQIAEGGLSFGGARSWMNNFMIDGIESNNLYNGAVVNSVSQEAIQEFQVISGTYAAELGRSAGGVVNIVTRYGTNNFHGSIYDFMRNDALDARPGLTRKGEDHFQQNQFGIILGGPIRRNKTFFFGNYEGQRKAKQEGFSSAFIQNIDKINQRKADFGLPLEDPSAVPSDDYDEFLVRVDHKFNYKVSANSRYNFFNENTSFQFVGGAVLPSAGEDASINNQAFMGNLTASLTSNLVSELRGGYSRRNRKKVSSSGFESGIKGIALFLIDVGSMGHLQTNIPTQSEEQIELDNNFSYFRGGHYIKFGTGFYRLGSEAVLAYFDPPNFRTNLASFLASPPLFGLIIAQEARTPVKVNATAFSGFFQDSWQVYPSLTFNYGIRYDIENIRASLWAPQIATRPPVVEPDKNNFQPRIGLVYSLEGGKTVIRSAFGIFHDKRITQNSLYELTFNPTTGAAKVFSPVTNLTDAFLQFISGKTTLASQFGPLTAQGIDINSFVNPYSVQWSLGIERSIGSDLVVGIHYLGTRGVHLISQVNGEKTNIAPWDGFTRAANGLPDYRFQLIDPRIAQYRAVASEGNSIYHGMTLTANKRFGNNFGFGVNYRFSKTIDDSTHLSSSSAPQDPYRRDLERGLSSNDVRHRFTFNLTADAPRTFPRVLRDFSIATITTLESGRPYSFRAGTDLNHDFLNTTDRVSLSGRNVFMGPGFASVDVRLSRLFSLSERLKLKIIAEGFNVLNRFNIRDINDVYGRAIFDQPPLPTFKTPTAAFDPRNIQLAIKLQF